LDALFVPYANRVTVLLGSTAGATFLRQSLRSWDHMTLGQHPQMLAMVLLVQDIAI